MTLTLHAYQVVARDHLRANPRSCLFLDMGLGKTAATLTALQERHLPALVVAPKRVAESVWPTEQRLWRADLSLRVIKGSKATRERLLAEPQADITVISRDNLRDLPGRSLSRGGFSTVVIDELSGFKNRSSVRWKTMRKVIREGGAEHVWGLTGTPSPNGLLDLWGQMALIDNGQRLGKTLGGYRAAYFTPGRQLPNGVIIDWPLRPGADKQIHDALEDICLSMTSDTRITLPPVTHNEVQVDLPGPARTAYQSLKKDLVADLDLLGGRLHSAPTAAALSNRLSQLSAGFIYHEEVNDEGRTPGTYDIVHREKVAALREVVEGTGSPVLVFYRYRAERDLIVEALGEDVHTIDEPDVIEHWNDGRVPVLLAHPASAGHGLNLQRGGHTIVWTSLPWSLEEWEQANKRLARQGQQHPVVIHTITSKRTIDPDIAAALRDKASVQDALLAHLESVL